MKQPGRPIFSVVIPVYNVERYIERCIDSVLAQTFRSFEIICVDDASPDNSVALVENYDDPRIRIVHQQNRGLAGARNTGINHSAGIFIALLDGDDFWEPQKLEAHFRHLQRNPLVDISYSASAFVDESGQPMGVGQFPKLRDITAAHIFCRNPVGNGSAGVIRRSLLQRVRRLRQEPEGTRVEYFDESLRQSEDIEFWLRAALQARARFEGLGEPLTCYRVNSSGLSANLERQFHFWQLGVEKNLPGNEEFFRQWYPLAKAYQKRYLARRALKSGNTLNAFQCLYEAVRSDPRIFIQEPRRTFLTCAAACCSLLPPMLYTQMEKLAMRFVQLSAKAH